MTPRSLAFSSLILSSAAVLSATASYGLVYPARAYSSKWPLLLGLLIGSLATCLSGWLSLVAQRRAKHQSERFLAMLGMFLCSFFLFVILFGLGIPSLIHGTDD